MSEQPDNMIIRLLQEMRAEAAARDEKTQAQIGELAQAVVRQSKRIDDQGARIDTLTETINAMRNDIRMISIAVDHHTARLDRIEQHLGLDHPRH